MPDTRPSLRSGAEVATAVAVLASIFVILVPVPAFILDLLLSLQLAVALAILFLSLRMRSVAEFTVFPTILLLMTVLGLALNISSTRLILQKGSAFDGKLIRAFGSFVAGGGTEGIVIGALIFAMILAVQLMVITRGSGRIAEVAARFSLDALPGRLMAIDTELGSGQIGQGEAAERKAALRREADFYGQMDGASRFVSGNAKVGLFITAVDILGGFVVGMALHGEDFSTALETYTTLTVGDGLSSQLPALLISVAAGIIVTRAGAGESFSSRTAAEFGAQRQIFTAVGAVLAVLAFLPGFPWYILLPLAALALYGGISQSARTAGSEATLTDKVQGFLDNLAARLFHGTHGLRSENSKLDDPDQSATSPTAGSSSLPVRKGSPATGDPDESRSPDTSGSSRSASAVAGPLRFGPTMSMRSGMQGQPIRDIPQDGPIHTSVLAARSQTRTYDAILFELGAGLVPMVLDSSEEKGENGFMLRLAGLRNSLSRSRGIPIPPTRLVDSPDLPPYGYRISLWGGMVASGSLRPGKVLAIPPQDAVSRALEDPTSMETYWIRSGLQAEPAAGVSASPGSRWIPTSQTRVAQDHGCRVATHEIILHHIVYRTLCTHVSVFLGRQEVHDLLDSLRDQAPVLVSELMEGLGLGRIRAVLRQLAEGGIWLAEPIPILEVLADEAASSTPVLHPQAGASTSIHHSVSEPGFDAEYMAARMRRHFTRQLWREALSRQCVEPFSSMQTDPAPGAHVLTARQASGVDPAASYRRLPQQLFVLNLSEALTAQVLAAARSSRGDSPVSPPAGLETALRDALARTGLDASWITLVCPAGTYRFCKDWLGAAFPDLFILAEDEFPAEAVLRSIARVEIPD